MTLQDDPHRFSNNIEILTFIIVIPSHQPINRIDDERKREVRRNGLPIWEVTKARAGRLA